MVDFILLFAVYFKSGFILRVHSFSCSGFSSASSSSSSSLGLACLKKSPKLLLSWLVLSLWFTGLVLGLLPRNGLLDANGFALPVLNAWNGFGFDFSPLLVANRLVDLLLNMLLDWDPFPNKGLDKFELSENKGLIDWELFELFLLIKLLLFDEKRLFVIIFSLFSFWSFLFSLLSLKLISKSFVCWVILLALIFGLSSEFNCESLLSNILSFILSLD